MVLQPMYAVAIFHFIQSSAFKILGQRLKLDENKDGVVNLADVVAWAAGKPWGWWLGMKLLDAELQAKRARRLDANHQETH